jgi:hypothetical protein
MSKTVRRKSYVPYWVKTKHVRVAPYQYARVPLEGKELEKSLAKHHSDAGYVTNSASGRGCPKWFRRDQQKQYRAECSQELHKFRMNNDYEVMIVAHPKLDYWD